jgi:hypothetical protein
VLSVLVALELALPEERDEWPQARAALDASPVRPLSEASLATLHATGFDAAPAQLARLLSEAVAEIDGLEPSSFGVSRSNLLSPKKPHEVRDAILSLASVVALPPGDVYVGGRDAAGVAGVAGKKGRTAWIVGDGLRMPLSSVTRFHVGRLAMALREEVLPFVARSPSQAAATLFAAAKATGSPLPAAAGRADLDELAAALTKMSRKTRKAVPELVAALPDGGASVAPWCHAALRTAVRAGLLVSGEIGAALSHLLGEAPSAAGVATNDDARDVVLFWLSSNTLALRRELGLAL